MLYMNTSSLHSVFAGLNTILVLWRPTLKGATRLTLFEIAVILYFLSYPSSFLLFKAGQTHSARTKCDTVDPDDPTRFQPWNVHILLAGKFWKEKMTNLVNRKLITNFTWKLFLIRISLRYCVYGAHLSIFYPQLA